MKYKVNLRGVKLRGADLAGADLAGADLAGADLRGAYLRGANLIGSNLGGANLIGSNLGGANLRGANLARAYLARANLTGVNLEGANLGGASLGYVNLRGANLAGTVLSGPIPTADLSGFEVRDGWVYGWRTATSQHVGSTMYIPGHTYTATHLSRDVKTECHPGLYFATREWIEKNYPCTPIVAVRARVGTIVKAGEKYRTYLLEVLDQ